MNGPFLFPASLVLAGISADRFGAAAAAERKRICNEFAGDHPFYAASFFLFKFPVVNALVCRLWLP